MSLYRLVPVGVNENTAPTLMTTADYAACRDYVTRAAPFEVYDALAPCAFGEAVPGPAFTSARSRPTARCRGFIPAN